MYGLTDPRTAKRVALALLVLAVLVLVAHGLAHDGITRIDELCHPDQGC